MKNLKKRKINIRTKKYALMATLLSATLFLSGCMRFDPDSGAPQGFLSTLVHDILIVPLEIALNYLGDFFGNYGLAIIVFTILFRLVLLPLTLRQQKGMIESQTKMATVQPVITEIQEEMKATDDPSEKQSLQMELMEIYKENDISIGGQLSSGCLPLLLQMPIFIAMLQVMRRSEALKSASLFGMNLGETSILLAVITGLIYFLQSKVMISAMPEEQQKTAGATMYMSPVMMLIIGVSSPAGIALYWMVSGIFTFFQQLFNTYYYKPKIENEIEEKLGGLEVVERKNKARREIQAVEESDSKSQPQKVSNKERKQNTETKPNRKQNRNVGIQQDRNNK